MLSRSLAALGLAAVLGLGACAAPGTGRPGEGGDFLGNVVAAAEDLGPVPRAQSTSVVVTLVGAGAAMHAERWAREQGLGAVDEPGSSLVTVSGPAAAVERAFGVRIRDYRSPAGIRFFAAWPDARVPAGLQGVARGVGRISDYRPWPLTRAVPAGGLKPADVIAAYDMLPLRETLGLDGSGETVVIWGTDGHTQADLDAFTSRFGLPPIRVEARGNPNVKPEAGAEEEMDIEVVHAIAPGARIVVYTPLEDSYAGYTALIDKITTENPGAIQTHSWGLCEQAWGETLAQAWLDVMKRSTQLGETVFAASGDRGGYECPPRDWSQPPTPSWMGLGIPDSIPYVTSVGGTRISVRTDGSWFDETVWVEHARTVGSTGGVSRFYKAGSWQKGPGTANRFNNGQRMEPDVSADADAVSGLAIYEDGSWEQGGGTSQSAPMWAAMTALVNQYLKKRGLKGVGFLSPALYDLAAGRPAYAPFHDVTVGNNMNFPATPGYDLATGLGTPDLWNLARDLEAYQRKGGRV